MNAWFLPSVKSYFWRNYNQSEVDYVEWTRDELKGVEMKWSTTKKSRVSRAFKNYYPEAITEVVTPRSFKNFIFEK